MTGPYCFSQVPNIQSKRKARTAAFSSTVCSPCPRPPGHNFFFSSRVQVVESFGGRMPTEMCDTHGSTVHSTAPFHTVNRASLSVGVSLCRLLTFLPESHGLSSFPESLYRNHRIYLAVFSVKIVGVVNCDSPFCPPLFPFLFSGPQVCRSIVLLRSFSQSNSRYQTGVFANVPPENPHLLSIYR